MRAYIETERLFLRNMEIDDYEAMFKWCGDPIVNEFMLYSLYEKAEDCRIYIGSLDPENPNVCDLGIGLKETGELIGMGGFAYHEDTDAWEIGYNLRHDMWGKGYASEAMKAVLDFIQERREVKAITGTFAVDNKRSGRVMEKLGMTYWRDCEYTKLDGSRTFKACAYRKDFV